MTAMANPDSVLYTRNLHGEGKNTSAWYGNVCSCFVSYVLDMPYMVTCADFPHTEGISEVDTTNLNGLQICDIVLNVKAHILLITDILRDSDGNIRSITVSESTPPQCMTTDFTPESFRNYYLDREYKVYRYDALDQITYTPSPYVHLEGDPDVEPESFPTLMTNFGNKANYGRGVDTVELSVFEEGWEAVEVTLPDKTIQRYPLEGRRLSLPMEQTGYQSACCVSGSRRSHSVQWCVTSVEVSTDKEVYANGEPIRVTFRSADPGDQAVVYLVKNNDDFNRKRGYISMSEAEAGELVIQQNERMCAARELSVQILFKNRYGIYTSCRVPFRIEGEAFS